MTVENKKTKLTAEQRRVKSVTSYARALGYMSRGIEHVFGADIYDVKSKKHMFDLANYLLFNSPRGLEHRLELERYNESVIERDLKMYEGMLTRKAGCALERLSIRLYKCRNIISDLCRRLKSKGIEA